MRPNSKKEVTLIKTKFIKGEKPDIVKDFVSDFFNVCHTKSGYSDELRNNVINLFKKKFSSNAISKYEPLIDALIQAQIQDKNFLGKGPGYDDILATFYLLSALDAITKHSCSKKIQEARKELQNAKPKLAKQASIAKQNYENACKILTDLDVKLKLTSQKSINELKNVRDTAGKVYNSFKQVADPEAEGGSVFTIEQPNSVMWVDSDSNKISKCEMVDWANFLLVRMDRFVRYDGLRFPGNFNFKESRDKLKKLLQELKKLEDDKDVLPSVWLDTARTIWKEVSPISKATLEQYNKLRSAYYSMEGLVYVDGNWICRDEIACAQRVNECESKLLTLETTKLKEINKLLLSHYKSLIEAETALRNELKSLGVKSKDYDFYRAVIVLAKKLKVHVRFGGTQGQPPELTKLAKSIEIKK